MELHLTDMECHLPCGITVLPATRYKWTCPALTRARQASTRFTYFGEMEGWVDLGDWLCTEMVYLPTVSQSPIQVQTDEHRAGSWLQVRCPNHYITNPATMSKTQKKTAWSMITDRLLAICSRNLPYVSSTAMTQTHSLQTTNITWMGQWKKTYSIWVAIVLLLLLIVLLLIVIMTSR